MEDAVKSTGHSADSANPMNQLPLAASWGIHIFFIIYSLLCIIPLVLIIAVSFSNEESVIREGYKFIPSQLDLSAYEFLFKDFRQIARSYGISIFVTVAGTLISLACMALYAYPISRSDF